jgi:hypothetical protein
MGIALFFYTVELGELDKTKHYEYFGDFYDDADASESTNNITSLDYRYSYYTEALRVIDTAGKYQDNKFRMALYFVSGVELSRDTPYDVKNYGINVDEEEANAWIIKHSELEAIIQDYKLVEQELETLIEAHDPELVEILVHFYEMVAAAFEDKQDLLIFRI